MNLVIDLWRYCAMVLFFFVLQHLVRREPNMARANISFVFDILQYMAASYCTYGEQGIPIITCIIKEGGREGVDHRCRIQRSCLHLGGSFNQSIVICRKIPS